MTHWAEDSEISAALESLPRHRPSEKFTASLLTRIDTGTKVPSRFYRNIGWTVATLLIFAIGITLGSSSYRRSQRQAQELQQLEALRARYTQLKTDVAGLKRSAANSPAVVYLGGNESYDLVIDLTEPPSYGASAPPARTVPANHRP